MVAAAVDSGQLQQALINLVMNAAEASPANGRFGCGCTTAMSGYALTSKTGALRFQSRRGGSSNRSLPRGRCVAGLAWDATSYAPMAAI